MQLTVLRSAVYEEMFENIGLTHSLVANTPDLKIGGGKSVNQVVGMYFYRHTMDPLLNSSQKKNCNMLFLLYRFLRTLRSAVGRQKTKGHRSLERNSWVGKWRWLRWFRTRSKCYKIILFTKLKSYIFDNAITMIFLKFLTEHWWTF